MISPISLLSDFCITGLGSNSSFGEEEDFESSLEDSVVGGGRVKFRSGLSIVIAKSMDPNPKKILLVNAQIYHEINTRKR